MKIHKTAFTQVDRHYIISSKELKEKLGLEGYISGINLWQGLSPEEKESGKSPDTSKWEIHTTEKRNGNSHL